MFQRLNTGGTHLSAQEIRNCLLIMINKPLYEIINDLHKDENFKNCTPLTDTQQEERYDLELVVRYLLYIAFAKEFISQIDKSRSMDTFLTEELEKYAQINILPGLFQNLDYWETHKAELKNRVQQLYAQEAFITATRRGTRALDRMCQLVSFSRTWFADED